jgi:hypothetical protein
MSAKLKDAVPGERGMHEIKLLTDVMKLSRTFWKEELTVSAALLLVRRISFRLMFI